MECSELSALIFGAGILGGGVLGVIGLVIIFLTLDRKRHNEELEQKLMERNRRRMAQIYFRQDLTS